MKCPSSQRRTWLDGYFVVRGAPRPRPPVDNCAAGRGIRHGRTVHDLTPSVPSADLPDLIRVAALGVASRESRAVRRRAAEGSEVRVGPGVFVSAERWRHCDERQRHALRVLARVPRLADRVAASHWSAAALHRFPSLEPWPTTVSVVDPVRTTTQSVSEC